MKFFRNTEEQKDIEPQSKSAEKNIEPQSEQQKDIE